MTNWKPWVIGIVSTLAGLAGHGGMFGPKAGPWVELAAGIALLLNKSLLSATQ